MVSSAINWAPYFKYIVEQYNKGEAIAADWCGTIETNSVVLSGLNQDVVAEGTEAEVRKAIEAFKAGTLHVFDTSKFTVNGETRDVLVGDGIAEVTPTFVLLLVDSAERPEDIDRNRAEAARIRAEERLQHKQSMHEYYQSKIALDRAMQRLQTAAKYKR